MMESELLYSKERLALKRRVQQQLMPAIEESTGSAWAHMRQRLFRAEREARAMRCLTIVLFCACLAVVAGFITAAPRWATAIGSRGNAGKALARAGDERDTLLLGVGPSPALSQPPASLRSGAPDQGSRPAPPTSWVPGPRGGTAVSEAKPGVAEPSVRSAGSPRTEPNVGPGVRQDTSGGVRPARRA